MRKRAYVDDATGGARDKETAMRISQGVEDTVENEGFCFKETIMTGDPLGKTGELQKVLGLRWNTEKYEISVALNCPEPICRTKSLEKWCGGLHRAGTIPRDSCVSTVHTLFQKLSAGAGSK